MATYTFTRTFTNGKWNINNPDDVDGNDLPVVLAKRVEAALPGKNFTVKLDDDVASVIFENPLTGPEQTTLNTTVSDHESASGTPDLSVKLNLQSPDGTNFEAHVSDLGVWVIV